MLMRVVRGCYWDLYTTDETSLSTLGSNMLKNLSQTWILFGVQLLRWRERESDDGIMVEAKST